MDILFATSNPHKIEEVQAILADAGLRVLSLADVNDAGPEPVEDAPTFEGNAQIKATEYAQRHSMHCLADDSGLEVDALDGAPGVYSARYAGAEGDRATKDAANNRKLMEALADVPAERRSARFVCALCLATPDGAVCAETRGTFEGSIVESEGRGLNGFGYDPLLQLPDDPRTSAELSAEEKNARSHRGDAVRQMVPQLRALTGG